MIPGTVAYNNALQHITDQFKQSCTNPAKPSQNSINQIRTNEFFGVPTAWELREFHLSSEGGLITVPVQMEPNGRFNSQSSPSTDADGVRFATYVNSHASQIAINRYVVPETIPVALGTTSPVIPFLGPSSFNPDFGEPVKYWDRTSTTGPGYINDDEARHIFSLNTCSGCHAMETNTNFVQINSGFLTSITVTDPANRPSSSPASRTFNDLASREMDLSNLLNRRCFNFGLIDLSKTLFFKLINMVH